MSFSGDNHEDPNLNSRSYSSTNPFAPKIENTNVPTVNQIMSEIVWPSTGDMPTIQMPPNPQFNSATPSSGYNNSTPYRNNNPFHPANHQNNPAFGEHRSPTNTNNSAYGDGHNDIYNNTIDSQHTGYSNYPNSNLQPYNMPDSHHALPQYSVPTLVINDVGQQTCSNDNANQSLQPHDGPASDSLSSSPRRSPPSSPRRYSHGASTLPRPNFLHSMPESSLGPPPLPPKLPPKSAPSSPGTSPRVQHTLATGPDASTFPVPSPIDSLDLVFPEMAIETEMLREKLHVGRDLKAEDAKPSDVRYAPPLSPRSSEQKREFLDAVIASDINKINELLAQGVNPNHQDDTGRTALHIVVLSKNLEVLKILLANPRIDPNAGDRTGLTPLHYVAAFLQDPVDMTLSPESSRAHTNEVESVKIMILNKLLQHPKTDVNIIDSSGNTPLLFAVSSGNLTVVSLLINRGANISNSTMNGTTPLHAACQEGHYKIVQFLIDLGAEVNVRDNFGDTPLHFAAKSNNKDIVAALKRAGAVMNFTNRQGRTPVDMTTSMDVRHILTGMKTSESNPLEVDFLEHLVLKNSKIGMCMCPGRSKKDHRRNLDSDVNILLRHNAQVLVTLVKDAELESMGIPNMMTVVKGAGIESIWFPIRDKWIPGSMDDLIRLVEQLIERIREGKVIVVHCNGGKGRTGLVVVATLCALGMSVDDAVKATRTARSGMIQNPAQILYARAFKRYWDSKYPTGVRI